MCIFVTWSINIHTFTRLCNTTLKQKSWILLMSLPSSTVQSQRLAYCLSNSSLILQIKKYYEKWINYWIYYSSIVHYPLFTFIIDSHNNKGGYVLSFLGIFVVAKRFLISFYLLFLKETNLSHYHSLCYCLHN